MWLEAGPVAAGKSYRPIGHVPDRGEIASSLPLPGQSVFQGWSPQFLPKHALIDAGERPVVAATCLQSLAQIFMGHSVDYLYSLYDARVSINVPRSGRSARSSARTWNCCRPP